MAGATETEIVKPTKLKYRVWKRSEELSKKHMYPTTADREKIKAPSVKEGSQETRCPDEMIGDALLGPDNSDFSHHLKSVD